MGTNILDHPSNVATALDGCEFGRDTVAASALTREIDASISAGSDRFSAGRAFIARPTATSAQLTFLLEITNTSPDTRRNIYGDELTFRGAQGQALFSSDWTPLIDLVGAACVSADRPSCLGPQESGWLISSSEFELRDVFGDPMFNSIHSVDIEMYIADFPGATLQPPLVGVDSYEFADIYPGSVTLTLRNVSQSAQRVTSAFLIWMDDAGTPVYWERPSIPEVQFGAGETAVQRLSVNPSWPGHATRLLGAFNARPAP